MRKDRFRAGTRRFKMRQLRLQRRAAGVRSYYEHPKLKAAATIALRRAVKRGKIAKPDACSRCGASGRIEGHHEDYRKPLVVIWLCTPCHRARHTEIRAEESHARLLAVAAKYVSEDPAQNVA